MGNFESDKVKYVFTNSISLSKRVLRLDEFYADVLFTENGVTLYKTGSGYRVTQEVEILSQLMTIISDSIGTLVDATALYNTTVASLA